MSRELREPKLQFELSILRFICCAGALRMGYELYSDIIREEPTLIFVVNICLFLVTVIPLTLSYTKINREYLINSYISISSFFLIYNWIISGGISGVSEYNMFALIVISGMVLRGSFLKRFILLLIIIEIIVVFSMEFRSDWFQDIIVKITIDQRYYLLLMPVCTLVFLYLRYSYDRDEDELLIKIEELKSKVEEVNKQNDNIQKKKVEYQNVNGDLAREIQLRKTQLEDRNQAITSFIKLSLRELYPPLFATINSIKKVTANVEEDVVFDVMSKSGDHLMKAYQKMTIKMRKNLS